MPRFCAHLGYQFTEVPLLERFEAAADAGFAAIELPGPYAHPAADLRARARARGLEYVQLALPLGNAAAGEKGIGCHPGREREQDDGLARALAYAVELGCRRIHPMCGIRPPDVSRDDALSIYVAAVRRAADAAAARGVDVLVEAINSRDVPGYLVDRPDVALEVIDRCARPNVRLLLDAYHATVVGEDPTAIVREHLPRIGHIQVADHPGRHEPGTGRIDFEAFFAALDSLGYAGWVGCEYVPSGRTEDGLGWLDRYR